MNLQDITNILKDLNQSLFFPHIATIEKVLGERERASKQAKEAENKCKYPCPIRNTEVELKPEEIVRQLYLLVLMWDKGYKKERIAEEFMKFAKQEKLAYLL